MKVYIDTNGCAILRHETYRLSKYFTINSFEEVRNPAEADIIVITGCGVTEFHENEAISLIDKIKKQALPSAHFIIGGCLPKINKDQILKCLPEATLIGYEESYKFDEIINANVKLENVYYNTGHPYTYSYDIEHFDDDTDLIVVNKIDSITAKDIMLQQYTYSTPRHYIWKESDVFQIRVSYGCGGNCSFCATKLGIGKFRSISKVEILRQLKDGVKQGFDKFVLVGDEIGFYGLDIGCDLMSLIDEMYEIAPSIHIAIRYIYPDMFVRYYSRLKKYFKNGYIYYFCTAIQSASPRILKMMNRNPDISDFVSCIKDIRENDYPVKIHTQIMVGFPSETDNDFALTIKCLLDCDFDYYNINKFSMRKNTKAYKYREMQLSDNIIQERCELLSALLRINRKSRLFDMAKKSLLNIQ